MAKLIVKRERQATRIGTNQICPYSQYHNEDCGEIVEEFYAATPWRETKQGWVKLRVGGFETRGTCAAVPHLGAALLNGRNGDNKKSVGVVDEINEGNTDIVVGRDCELTCGCELCQ